MELTTTTTAEAIVATAVSVLSFAKQAGTTIVTISTTNASVVATSASTAATVEPCFQKHLQQHNMRLTLLIKEAVLSIQAEAASNTA